MKMDNSFAVCDLRHDEEEEEGALGRCPSIELERGIERHRGMEGQTDRQADGQMERWIDR